MAHSFRRHIARHYLSSLDRARRSPFRQIVRIAQRNESLSRSELERLNTVLCEQLLAHAYREVAAYQSRLKSVCDGHIENWDDIPILTKTELVGHEGDFRGLEHGRLFRGRTSGSTGRPLEFAYDSQQMAWRDAVQWRGRSWWGLQRGDPAVVLWGRPVSAGGRTRDTRSRLVNYLRNTYQVNVFEDSDAVSKSRVLSIVKRQRPAYLYGYGSAISWLFALLEETEGDEFALPFLRMIEYTADHMHYQDREQIARVTGVPIISAYGASEVPSVAQECPEGSLHIAMDNVVVEVVDDDGIRLPQGSEGRILLTTLRNYAMPLIRYEIGDIGRLEDYCSCGRPSRTLMLTGAKVIEVIETSEVQGVSAHVLDYINLSLMNRGIRGVIQFEVQQLGLDRFKLILVPDSVATESERDQFAEGFCQLMRARLGHSIEVEREWVSWIGVGESGKRSYYRRLYDRA